MIAVVTNSDDPTKAGRVKLKFPWLADDYESDWARTVAVGAGDSRGIAFLPEVGDEVLVAFERGDVRSPFVLGALWSTKNQPPRNDKLIAGGAVNERVIVSREGHRIVFSDDDSNGGISIMSGDDNYAINILVSNQKIQIQSTGEIEITATTDLTLKGQSVKISGTSIDIEADATLQLKGGATSITGQPLSLN